MDNTKLKGRMSGKVQELQQPAENQNITVTSAPETTLAPVDSTYLALTNNALEIIRSNFRNSRTDSLQALALLSPSLEPKSL